MAKVSNLCWFLIWSLLHMLLAYSGVGGIGIPMLITRGSHHEFGFEMGQTFKSQIHQFFAVHPQFMKTWLQWSKTEDGAKTMAGFLKAAKTHFPQYVEELAGLGHGAGIPFNQIFLMAHGPEVSAIFRKNQTSLTSFSKDCTDIYVNHPGNDCVVLGHNEDNAPYNTGFLVSAQITDNSTRVKYGKEQENFTAFSYFGLLPGEAFGFNGAGLVVTCNAQYPTQVALGKIGRNILNRALLSAGTQKEVSDMLNDPELGAAYGFTVNIGMAGGLHRQPDMLNIEVAPDTTQLGSKVDTYQVSASQGNYYHVNMYRRLDVKEFDKNIVSSQHRTARINQLPLPTSVKGILTILGDTQDGAFPIYRTPRETDNELTLATALFDLQLCSMSVYRGNPKTDSKPLYVFPMYCER